jgi:hypothetical protein
MDDDELIAAMAAGGHRAEQLALGGGGGGGGLAWQWRARYVVSAIPAALMAIQRTAVSA